MQIKDNKRENLAFLSWVSAIRNINGYPVTINGLKCVVFLNSAMLSQYCVILNICRNLCALQLSNEGQKKWKRAEIEMRNEFTELPVSILPDWG